MSDTDVVVVGAGLAGLRAARVLAATGLSVTVLEAGDAVGGRERTDEVDGFRLDRGFHVVNPAYPALSRAVDPASLDLRPFGPGLNVRLPERTVTLARPGRQPRRLAAALRSGLVPPRTAWALARWLTPVLVRPGRVKTGPDTTLAEALAELGLTGSPLEPALRTFLAGVLGDEDGTTSAAFVALLLRSFALGSPGVPALGVRRLPELLAEPLPDVRTRTAVRSVVSTERSAAVGTDSGVLRARAVVLAVGPREFGDLTGTPTLPTRRLSTWWFAAEERPSASTMLFVDGRRPRGPVVNAAVMSNVAPWAPLGRHLVQASCVTAAGEDVVRRQVGELLGVDAAAWTLLRRDVIEGALPVQSAPLRLTTPAQLGPRLFAAGDHRTTASIQGALVSGERAARAVARALSLPPQPRVETLQKETV